MISDLKVQTDNKEANVRFRFQHTVGLKIGQNFKEKQWIL